MIVLDLCVLEKKVVKSVVWSLFTLFSLTPKTSSADADKPARRVFRSVKVTKHSTSPYVRYSFLLCNSNSVLKTRRFYDIRLQKMS